MEKDYESLMNEAGRTTSRSEGTEMSGDRHSGMDPEFERIVTAARATHREALDRLAATDRCSHGENPDPNCHWCRPLSSTPPRPEDCAHESLVRTKDARWYCGACGVWFVPEAPDV